MVAIRKQIKTVTGTAGASLCYKANILTVFRADTSLRTTSFTVKPKRLHGNVRGTRVANDRAWMHDERWRSGMKFEWHNMQAQGGQSTQSDGVAAGGMDTCDVCHDRQCFALLCFLIKLHDIS